jgi:hypothetical protein
VTPGNTDAADDAELGIERRESYALMSLEESVISLPIRLDPFQFERREDPEEDHLIMHIYNEGIEVT